MTADPLVAPEAPQISDQFFVGSACRAPPPASRRRRRASPPAVRNGRIFSWKRRWSTPAYFCDRPRLGESHQDARLSVDVARAAAGAARNSSCVGIMRGGLSDDLANVREALQRFVVGQDVGRRMIVLPASIPWPTSTASQLVSVNSSSCSRKTRPGPAEHVELIRQPLGRIELAAVVPERASRRARWRDSAAPGSRGCRHIPGRSGGCSARSPARRSGASGTASSAARCPIWTRWMLVEFERLEKPAGKPSATTFLTHGFLAVPGREAQRSRLGKRRSVEVGEQRRPPLRRRRCARSNRRSRCRSGAGAGSAIASPRRARSTGSAAAGRRRARTAPQPPGRRAAISTSRRIRHSSVCSISRPRKPEQSMNRSPSIRAPLSQDRPLRRTRSRRSATTSTIRPSVRTDAGSFGTVGAGIGRRGGVELERIGDLRQRRVRLIGPRVVRSGPGVPATIAERIVVERRRIAERYGPSASDGGTRSPSCRGRRSRTDGRNCDRCASSRRNSMPSL